MLACCLASTVFIIAWSEAGSDGRKSDRLGRSRLIHNAIREMKINTKHIRHGFGSVRPYLYGGLELPDFVQEVFGAVELERHEFSERSFHYEGRLGDSVIVIEAGDLPAHVSGTKASTYVYVEDVDQT